MRIALNIALAATSLIIGAEAQAADGCGTYPQAVYDKSISAGWSDCNLKKMGEVPLWNALPSTSKQIMRFVFTEGHVSFFRSVTITEKLDGTGELTFGGGDREKRPRVYRRLALTIDQISKLNSLAMQSDAWKFEIGSWDGSEIFMHCQLLEMEQSSAAGYRYSSVNIGCNHPAQLMPLIDEVVRLAGLKAESGGRLYR